MGSAEARVVPRGLSVAGGLIGREFLARLDALPDGYAEGEVAGRRWGVTLDRSTDGRRCWLYGEELGGRGRVSFNLYRTTAGPVLRPCEMPVAAVIRFVERFTPRAESAASGP